MSKKSNRNNSEQLPPLEQGLFTALRSIDTQILREVESRNPAQLEEHGLRKWNSYESRIERICSFVLNSIGDDDLGTDGVLVMAQAMSKTLMLVVEDLEQAGLGKTRSEYCRTAAANIERDMNEILQLLQDQPALN